jgi:hypothetical protein
MASCQLPARFNPDFGQQAGDEPGRCAPRLNPGEAA